MKKLSVVVVVVALAASGEAKLTMVAPRDGETVPLLWDKVKAFLDMPREARKMNRLNISKAESRSYREVRGARPVEFAWTGDSNAVYRLSVRRLPDGRVFHEAVVTGCVASLAGRLEIAREWEWTVSGSGENAVGRFRTEDRAPRIISLDGVSNARDIGGRIGLGGRRIKQGLVLRTGGLNHNAKIDYYTYDEIMKMHEDGTLAAAGIGKSRGKGAEYEAKIRSGRKIDKDHLRLIKTAPSAPGAERLSQADREYLLDFIGVKSDIDLRDDWECYGMTGSPLGERVAFYHYHCQGAYGKFVTPVGRATAAQVFSVLTEKKNYPVVFHCIGGTDRTGTFAYLLEGLLGVDEEDMIRDYEMSFISAGGVDKRHLEWLERLVEAVHKLPGDTIAEKMERYFVSLGFTVDEVRSVREFLLEK